MLAILAIFIAVLVIWGYSGIKEVRKSIEDDVTAKADAALALKLSEYPDAASILRMFNGLKEQFELMEQLRNQMIPQNRIMLWGRQIQCKMEWIKQPDQ